MKKESNASRGDERASASRVDVRERLSRLRGARRRSIFGLPEIAGLASAGVLLFAALFSYFSLLLPMRSRLTSAGEERTKLQNELRLSTEGIRREETTQASVEKILSSLDDFEIRNLVSREEAGTAVIEELNGLIRRNGLRIATGVSFTQFEEISPNAPPGQQRAQQAAAGAVKPIQTVFPGVGVNLTVEGSYANLRRFIRGVEADRRFIVINAVELEGVTDASSFRAAAAAETAPDAGGAPAAATGIPGVTTTPTRGNTLVSLRLNMAAYFRRAGVSGQQPSLSETERGR